MLAGSRGYRTHLRRRGYVSITASSGVVGGESSGTFALLRGSESELHKLQLVDLVGKCEDEALEDAQPLRTTLGGLEESFECARKLMP